MKHKWSGSLLTLDNLLNFAAKKNKTSETLLRIGELQLIRLKEIVNNQPGDNWLDSKLDPAWMLSQSEKALENGKVGSSYNKSQCIYSS